MLNVIMRETGGPSEREIVISFILGEEMERKESETFSWSYLIFNEQNIIKIKARQNDWILNQNYV